MPDDFFFHQSHISEFALLHHHQHFHIGPSPEWVCYLHRALTYNVSAPGFSNTQYSFASPDHRISFSTKELNIPLCFFLHVSALLCPGQASLKVPQRLLLEAVGELPLHLLDLTGTGVVPQGPGHLLVRHGLAVPLPPAPQLRQTLLVLGGELEGASGGLDPPDAAPHRRCLEHLEQELEQPLLPLSCKGGTGCKNKRVTTMTRVGFHMKYRHSTCECVKGKRGGK